MNLNQFFGFREFLVGTRRNLFIRFLGMDLDPTMKMSLSAKLDLTFPKGVHVGPYSYIAFNARVLTHDRTRGLYLHTRIGKNCFIGGCSLILPGVQVGDGSIVGAGSVVTRDVPPGCIVAGNPAKTIRQGISVGEYGRLDDADERERELRATDPVVGAQPSKLRAE